MSSTSAGSRAPLSAQADYIFSVSESLAMHPKFFVCLQEIVNYLQLSDKGWALVLHARRDSHDSLILEESHPQLFKVPNDIINQVDTLRSGDKWNHYRPVVLDRFSSCASHARKLSLQIPEPQHRPTSYASTASSARSSLPPHSGSEASARSSMSSGYISDWSAHYHLRAPSHSSAPWEAEPATRLLAPSSAVQRARKMVEPMKCPCCDKLYEKYGFLVRHLKVEHPGHPAAQKHFSKEFRDLPTRNSNVEEDIRESMPPPSALAPMNGATSSFTAFCPVRDEKPLPPVPAKEGLKRPFPDSPTSQFGPRAATDPATEAETQPCGAEAAVQDRTCSDCFSSEPFEDILGILPSHDFNDAGQDMEFVRMARAAFGQSPNIQ